MLVRSCRFGAALALIIAFGGASARAQEPTSAGRPWVDPPARATASPAPARVEAQKAPDAPKTGPTRRPKAQLAQAAHRRIAVQARRAVAAPRIAASRRAASRMALITPRATPAPRQIHRQIALRQVAPTTSPAMIRRYYGYGYTSEALSPGPMAQVSYGDERAERIRQARNAGFLVMRSSVFARPDGGRLQVYQPYPGPDEDDD